MRAWVNGQILPDPTAPAVGGRRPRTDRRRRGLRGDQGRRRRAVRAHPPPRPAGPQRGRAGAARRSTTTPYGAGSRPCSRARTCRSGRIRITYTGGPAPLGSRPWRRAADAGRGRDAMDAVRPRRRRSSTVPVAAQRARRAGRPQDHVVRRERASRSRYAAERGATEAVFANLAGQPLRGHRLQRLLRRRRRAAHPDPRQRLPGRRHPRPDHRVVRRASRSTSRSRSSSGASEIFLASTTRDVQGVSPVGRPRAPGAGPVTAKARATWAEREAEHADP